MTGAEDYQEENGGTFSAWKNTYNYNNSTTVTLSIPPFCCKFKKKLSIQAIEDIEDSIQGDYTMLRSKFKSYLQNLDCLSNKTNEDYAWINKVFLTNPNKQ